MSNVIKFEGAFRPDAMEREADEATREVRRKQDSAMRSLAPIRRPSVLPTIHLDNSLWARLVRAWQRLRSFL